MGDEQSTSGIEQNKQCDLCGCAESEHPTIADNDDGPNVRCEGVYELD